MALELKKIICKCGYSPDTNIVENGFFRCKNCNTLWNARIMSEEAETRHERLVELFGELVACEKEERIAVLRSNLWREVHEKFIDDARVIGLAREIRDIVGEDFQAEFYEIASGSNTSRINDFLNGIDVSRRAEYIVDIFEYMTKPLKYENLLALIWLVERAYKAEIIDGATHDEYLTLCSENEVVRQNEATDAGAPRDVFIAYKSEDMAHVVKLCEFLEENGLTCFVSARNLPHGRGAVREYEPRLRQAIDACSVVVFVSSKQSRLKGDAKGIELPYIKAQDMAKAPAEYKIYENLPYIYKKPRVEYVIEPYQGFAYERYTNEFFHGLTRRENMQDVYDDICEQINAVPRHALPTAEVKDDFSDAVRGLCIRGLYDRARELCEKRLDETPADIEGYMGLVRIATEDYTVYEGKEIDAAVRMAQRISRREDLSEFDSDYAEYVLAREKYFAEAQKKDEQSVGEADLKRDEERAVAEPKKAKPATDKRTAPRTPKSEPAEKVCLHKDYPIGGTIEFGSYPQTFFGVKKPIKWEIIKSGRNGVLLLSQEILDAHAFNDKRDGSFTTSSLRVWLNNDFADAAFTDAEKERIIFSNADSDDPTAEGYGLIYWIKLFVLSREEAEKYIPSAAKRSRKVTSYAKKRGAYVSNYVSEARNTDGEAEKEKGFGWWWLRSCYRDFKDKVEHVNDDGSFGWGTVYDSKYGVVPALWLKV